MIFESRSKAEPSLLGGRFMACWLAFLAVMAVWAARRPAEARLPFLALTVYPAGALIAGLRSIADLAPSTAQWGYLVVLGIATVVFGVGLGRTQACRPVGGPQ